MDGSVRSGAVPNPSPSHSLRERAPPSPSGRGVPGNGPMTGEHRIKVPSPVGRRRGPLAKGQWEDEGVWTVQSDPAPSLTPPPPTRCASGPLPLPPGEVFQEKA